MWKLLYKIKRKQYVIGHEATEHHGSRAYKKKSAYLCCWLCRTMHMTRHYAHDETYDFVWNIR